jgi:iron complex outermembrane receptor protein
MQLNANNLADRTYWVGGYDYIRLFPGAPRNFLLTLGYML